MNLCNNKFRNAAVHVLALSPAFFCVRLRYVFVLSRLRRAGRCLEHKLFLRPSGEVFSARDPEKLTFWLLLSRARAIDVITAMTAGRRFVRWMEWIGFGVRRTTARMENHHQRHHHHQHQQHHFLETDFAKIALERKMYHQQCQLRRDVSEQPVDASSVSGDCCYPTDQWHYNSTVTPMKQIEGMLLQFSVLFNC